MEVICARGASCRGFGVGKAALLLCVLAVRADHYILMELAHAHVREFRCNDMSLCLTRPVCTHPYGHVIPMPAVVSPVCRNRLVCVAASSHAYGCSSEKRAGTA
eukprot:4297916-Pleurochrysis_carterae.AAC.2